jgi:hypothetical protein
MSGDARLLHQVHPAKLATDISAELVSGVLLWRQQPAWGLAVPFLPPIVASAVVLHWVDVEALRNHPAGRYVLVHMPPAAEVVRLAGDAMMAYGAWRRRPAVVAAGIVMVGLGWSRGLLPPATGSAARCGGLAALAAPDQRPPAGRHLLGTVV